ncbi:MAG: efflux RND transporter periplasmic adaptor subunit [Gammaproteobacteria bacterium]|nr:MAG: efflux RND transporter periplasmic adaptor subunit [Gammaproteobacteria bacterium]
MKLINTLLVLTVLLCSLQASAQTQTTAPGSDQHAADTHDEHNASANVDHDNHEEGGHDAEEQAAGVVELTKVSRAMAGIEVTKLTKTLLPEVINAPGEVQLDQYRSAEVTPLVDAVVVKRHARLGDAVVAGQRLVTLASVAVADAQGELRVSAAEWQRVGKLGQATVGAKRYTGAEVAYQQARLKLSAYGLDEQQIEAISRRKLIGSLGQFALNAPVAGTVLRDDFRLGQRIEAGQSLFLIADESQIWVEANLSPRQAQHIQIDGSARINMGGHWHDGVVIQKHHLLDEQTRTVPVRIGVTLVNEHHHPGEFVQVEMALAGGRNPPTLAVPESALMQDDAGNWTVFVEFKADHFKQTPIKRESARAGLVPISGLAEGTVVATEGAFFLAAELAKSGFDIHNH